MLKSRKPNKRGLSFLAVALLVTLFIVLSGVLDRWELAGLAQTPPEESTPQSTRIRVSEVWKKVYEQLPNLPKENQYILQETGKVAEENTLISRLIRYHIYVKGRPPQYRFDWKLTLADYLGVNEPIIESAYPGGEVLRENPALADQKAIQQLNREQRETLVNTLVSLFNPTLPRSNRPQPNPNPMSSSPTPQPPNSSLTPLPESGAADLLK